uniref:Retrotransposon gag domain-containing protein n=1 Tax=Glossina austeni TaxID=7395 RepID=A0A1A9VQD5_GLOAU
MDKICKWSVRCNGGSCALEFVVDVEELCEVCELPLDIIPRRELLDGQAAIWYRNNRKSWAGWQEFKQEFFKFSLDTRYLERLDDKDMMRHFNYTTQQQLESTCRNSRREYQLFFGNTVCQDLKEMISLGERFEDIPAPTVASPPRETSGPSRVPKVNAPTTTYTSRYVLASLTAGGLKTTGVIDAGATRSVIRKDMIGFIPRIIATKANGNTIQMADGSLRDSKYMIMVEVYVGDVSFNLELLVLEQSA